MILRALTLDGVGPYADRQTLEFATSDRRPVTLVGGLNGSGKTTLIRSLFHVLYGARSVQTVGRSGGYRAFLSDSVNHTRDKAALELELMIPGLRDDASLVVRRQWRALGRRAAQEELDVFVNGAYDEELSECWDATIERVAPLGVARLFFFDGEQIEAMADLDAAASSLRTAVGALLGLDVIDQLRTDLAAVQRRVARDAEPDAPQKIEDYERRLDTARELASGIRDRVEELETQYGQAVEDEQRLVAALRASGGDLVAQRDELDRRLTDARRDETTVWAAVRELAIDPVAPLMLVADLLAQAGDTARTREHQTTRQLVLDVLTERDAWLVGEVDSDGLLDQLLADDRARRIAEMHEVAPFEPVSPSRDIDELVQDRLSAIRVDALRLLDRVDQASAATDELDRAISRIPAQESVLRIVDAAHEACERVAELAGLLEEQRGLLAAAEAQVTKATERRDGALARLADRREAQDRDQRVLRHAQLAKETLAAFASRIASRHVERITQYTVECLNQLLRKERLIVDITLDPETFAVGLIDANGRRLKSESLSAGERQLTALSLLWALARAAGRPLPVVIDTPLGRLDAAHRRHVVERYFPAAGHQVVVLSTDTEIDGQLYETLRPAIGAEHFLSTDTDGITRIERGYLELCAA